MAQILPQQGSFGETLGRGLGTGIGSALQNLASLKLNQLQQRQERDQLYKALVESGNWTPELARLAVSFPANQRLEALNILSRNIQSGTPQQQAQTPAQVQNQDLSSILSQMQTKAEPLSGLELLRLGQQQQLQQTPLGKKLSQEQSPFDLNVLANEQAQKMLNLSPEHQNRLQERIQEISKDVNKQNQLKEELGKFLQASPEEQQKQLQQLQQPFTQQQQRKQPILFNQPLTEAQKIGREKLELSKRKEQREIEAGESKESKEFFDQTLKEDNAAKKSDIRLNRMEHLIKEGSLPVSHLYRLFTNLSETDIGKNAPIIGPIAGLLVNPVINAIGGAGLGLQRQLTSKDTEEYEKLQAEFLRDIKDVFGSRISNLELDSYLKLIPTLANTDAGKLKIIDNLKAANKAIHLKSKTMKQIIKENKGKRPANLELLVDERTSNELDKLAKDVIESPSLRLI